MIAVPPVPRSGDCWGGSGGSLDGRGGDVGLLSSWLAASRFDPFASLNNRARYVSVASLDPQSLCCAITGETWWTLSRDVDASSGEMTDDWWYMFKTEFTTLYVSVFGVSETRFR